MIFLPNQEYNLGHTFIFPLNQVYYLVLMIFTVYDYAIKLCMSVISCSNMLVREVDVDKKFTGKCWNC